MKLEMIVKSLQILFFKVYWIFRFLLSNSLEDDCLCFIASFSEKKFNKSSKALRSFETDAKNWIEWVVESLI